MTPRIKKILLVILTVIVLLALFAAVAVGLLIHAGWETQEILVREAA